MSLIFSACAENKIPEELDSYEDICWEDNIYGHAGARTDENNNTPENRECVTYEAAVICIITTSGEEQEHIIIIAYTV